MMEKAWTHIVRSLVPYVTMEEDLPVVVECSGLGRSSFVDESTDGLTWFLVDNIVRGVQCSGDEALFKAEQ